MTKINEKRNIKDKLSINDKDKLSYLKQTNEKHNKIKILRKYKGSEKKRDKILNNHFYKNKNSNEQNLIKNKNIKYMESSIKKFIEKIKNFIIKINKYYKTNKLKK